MRRRVLVFLLALALSGCAGAGNGSKPLPSGTDPVSESPEEWVVQAPELLVGQSWTYRTGGYWDAMETVTIVVARADADGYLFAGASEEDLLDEVFWDRDYLGPMSQDLHPLDAEGARTGAPLVAFPLQNGSTWRLYNMDVVASGTMISVLGTMEQGFQIVGEDDGRRVEVEYAPSVGAVTHFAYIPGADGPAQALDLVEVGDSSPWVWLEQSAAVTASSVVEPASSAANPPEMLPVTDTDDAVMLWGLAAPGSKGVAVPPDGASPWTFDGDGVPNFRFTVLPAAEGLWQITGVPGDPEGWVYLQAHAVRWIKGP